MHGFPYEGEVRMPVRSSPPAPNPRPRFRPGPWPEDYGDQDGRAGGGEEVRMGGVDGAACGRHPPQAVVPPTARSRTGGERGQPFLIQPVITPTAKADRQSPAPVSAATTRRKFTIGPHAVGIRARSPTGSRTS